jgi:hypothetical protein
VWRASRAAGAQGRPPARGQKGYSKSKSKSKSKDFQFEIRNFKFDCNFDFELTQRGRAGAIRG